MQRTMATVTSIPASTDVIIFGLVSIKVCDITGRDLHVTVGLNVNDQTWLHIDRRKLGLGIYRMIPKQKTGKSS